MSGFFIENNSQGLIFYETIQPSGQLTNVWILTPESMKLYTLCSWPMNCRQYYLINYEKTRKGPNKFWEKALTSYISSTVSGGKKDSENRNEMFYFTSYFKMIKIHSKTKFILLRDNNQHKCETQIFSLNSI
jgi:hypothetical protein